MSSSPLRLSRSQRLEQMAVQASRALRSARPSWSCLSTRRRWSMAGSEPWPTPSSRWWDEFAEEFDVGRSAGAGWVTPVLGESAPGFPASWAGWCVGDGGRGTRISSKSQHSLGLRPPTPVLRRRGGTSGRANAAVEGAAASLVVPEPGEWAAVHEGHEVGETVDLDDADNLTQPGLSSRHDSSLLDQAHERLDPLGLVEADSLALTSADSIAGHLSLSPKGRAKRLPGLDTGSHG